MKANEGGTRLTRRRKLLFASISSLLVVLVLGVVFEGVLRLVGVRPWHKRMKTTRVEPGGSFFRKDPNLGYTHLPGSFKVTLEDGYSFHVTHLPNTLRITHPLDTYGSEPPKEEIWIFGCSFTHGWCLNDEETYPWLLQQRFPQYEIVNFGVSGYGTLHALLQFREALEHKHPRLVVLTYASFHDGRNTFLRKRQKAVATWNSLGPLLQPYARLDKSGELHVEMATQEYREFPLMRHLALAHFIEMTYDNYEGVRTRSYLVSEKLVLEMDRVAKEHGTRLVIAFIAEYRGMKKFADEHGIPNIDISLDMSKPEYTNNPHDGHPSALANRLYADKLQPFLESILNEPVAVDSTTAPDHTVTKTRDGS